VKRLLRRLERIEARIRTANQPISFLIQFVDPEKGVVRTLQLGPGYEQVWTDLQPDPEEWPPSTSDHN
jgi:hypothetical protein